LILLHVADHEPEVRGDEALSGGRISLLGEPSETTLFGCIRDQGELLDIVKVLIEGGGRG
jgi:hypothetical protein